MGAPVLRMSGVGLVRGGRAVLAGVNWTVRACERWIVLGPNGSGKTSLVQLASGYAHPSVGTVEVLGARLGRVDVRALRARIGLVSGAVTRLLRPHLTAAEIVLTGLHAALEPWWHEYGEAERRRAVQLLDDAGCGALADRTFAVLSEGERQQVLLARSLMGRPELLLLDEPAASLDLGARERLVSQLATLAGDAATPPVVFVTHHVEEIPETFTHALLLRAGGIVTAGPLRQALTSESLSACFDLPLALSDGHGRFTCRAR